MFEIAWRSEDRQGSMPMGEYVSLEVARRELPTCQAELLAQCLDDAEDPTGAGGLMTKAACLKGTWVVYDTDDDTGATLEVACADVALAGRHAWLTRKYGPFDRSEAHLKELDDV
jgi:hypothetical protein